MAAYGIRALALATVSAVALTATNAAAQSAAPADAGVEALVVTAQKRDQNAIEVPIALTAYTGDFLDRLGVKQFDQLSQFVPGFEVQNQSPNNPGFVMRGITSDSGDSAVEPRVSVFQDGVSISKSRGSFVELFDNQRVEIAKGPQSTLFGRGALIGAVNIIQNKAEPGKFDYRASAEAGSLDYRMLEGMANLPFGEQFALRVAGRFKLRDGYVDNALGGDALNSQDTSALRVSAKFKPNDRFNADLIVNYEEDFPTGTSFKSKSFSPTDPASGAVLAGREPWEPAALAPAVGFEGYKPLGLERYVWGVTGLIDYQVTETLKLSSISAFRRFQSEEVFDADGTSLPILTAAEDARGRQWSQEVRLNYDGGGRFSAFAGVSYFKEEGAQRVPTQFNERLALATLTSQLNASAAGSGLPASNPAPLGFFSNTQFTGALLQGAAAALSGNRLLLPAATAQALAGRLRDNHIETATNGSDLTSYDVFADATFRATDRLELSAGIRFTADEKTSTFTSSVIGGRSVLGGVIGAAQLAAAGDAATANTLIQGLAAFGSNLSAPLPFFGLSTQPTVNNGDTGSFDHSDSGVTWRMVARYKASEDLNLYASYSRGRRPEVVSARAPSAPFAPPRFVVVDAETVDSFEAGAKAQLFDKRLRLDVSVYHYLYQNFQTQEQEGTLFVTTNAGKAKATGVELQGQWSLGPWGDLFATYAYSHARFDGGAYDGNRFRLSPDQSFSIGAALRMDALGGTFTLLPSYTWQSKTFFDDNNDLPRLQQLPNAFVADNIQDEFQPGYGLVNLRFGYAPTGANWRVEVFANNLANKKYIKDAGNTGDGLGLPTFIAGEPRVYGVGFHLRR